MSTSSAPDPELWKLANELLDQVLDLPKEEVGAFLDRQCADRPELRAEVEAYLEAEASEGFLEQSVADWAAELIPVEEAEAEASQPVREGHGFGPYRVKRPLGRGGMGWVYEAEDTRLGRRVALKLLPEAFDHGDGAKERFLREARLASSLDHPNICTLHDIGTDEAGNAFLVMAFYAGETLRDRLQRGPIEPGEARKIAIRIARGLSSAHEQGIVHRDIKPANLMLTDRGELKILDFGIARLADEGGLTRTGMAPGTPAYMSPEQVSGERADARSDLWSLGVVLYQMLSGGLPFAADGTKAMLFRILGHEAEPIDERVRGLPADLVEVVCRLLEKDRDRRYGSAAEVLRALGESADPSTSGIRTPDRDPAWVGSPASEVEATRTQIGADAGSPNLDTEPERLAPELPAPRAKWLPWLLGIGLVVGMGLLLLVLRLGPFAETETTGDGASGASAEVRGDAATELLSPPALDSATRIPLAVLRFQNLTEDPNLDWMSRGVPEMLVTDLAQAPGLDVLDPARSQRFERQSGAVVEARPEAGGPDPEQLRRFAAMASVAVVVRGSFIRLGERFRLAYRVEEPASGELLLANRVEGRGEESLFGLVDQVGAAIRLRLELPSRAEAEPGAGEGVEAVTTSSLEAWRLYTEGLALHRSSKTREALPMLEKAIELDPDFALAHAELGKMRLFLGHADIAAEHTRRALELGRHLPLDQRFYLEANDAATRWSSYPLAIERFGEALEIYPEREAWRAYRAYLLASVDRYEEAREEYDRLIEAGTRYAPTYLASANVSAALGNEGAGYRLLADRSSVSPDDWFLALGLGWHLATWGQLDEASRALDRAEAARPGDPLILSARFRLAVLSGDFAVADRAIDGLLANPDPSARWRGWVHSANLALLRGDATSALAAFESASEMESQSGPNRALACSYVADVLLATDRADEALPWTECARKEGEGHWPEVLATFQATLAAARAGDDARAASGLRELESRLEGRSNLPEERQLLHLRGLLALEAGDIELARQRLEEARILLAPRGVEIHEDRLPDHLGIWWSLARAYLAAGGTAARDPGTAEGFLREIVGSGSERMAAIVPFVEAHHELAALLDERGQPAEAERWRALYPALGAGRR